MLFCPAVTRFKSGMQMNVSSGLDFLPISLFWFVKLRRSQDRFERRFRKPLSFTSDTDGRGGNAEKGVRSLRKREEWLIEVHIAGLSAYLLHLSSAKYKYDGALVFTKEQSSIQPWMT
jgi:hypothetical protein